jgi:antitoxin ParD1/3/4
VKIELPDALAGWVEAQCELGAYPSPDAFVVAVLQYVRARMHEKLDQQLLEGLDSGEPIAVTPELWEEQRRDLEKYIANLGKAAG